MRSDDDNDQPYYSNEELEEESYFIQSVLPTKMRKKKCVEDLRQPRQKFLAKWEQDFPWLRADKVDQSIGICIVCNKQLVCKKSHMERHEKSFKHMRLQGFDPSASVESDNMQPTAPEFLECGKREFEDTEDFENTIELDPGTTNEEYEAIPAKAIKREVAKMPVKKPTPIGKQKRTAVPKSAPTVSTPVRKSSAGKLNRYKLLKRIDRDRQELNEYYYAQKQLYAATTPPSRDSFDLFFESVGASVKTLPPKLAAELKSRVSQIVAEFELRAICEREQLQNASVSAENTAVVASTTHEAATEVVAQEHISTDMDGSAVPHIIYTFQPKIRE